MYFLMFIFLRPFSPFIDFSLKNNHIFVSRSLMTLCYILTTSKIFSRAPGWHSEPVKWPTVGLGSGADLRVMRWSLPGSALRRKSA